MSQITRAEVNALLKKAAKNRRKSEEIEAELQAIAARIAGDEPKPDRPATSRKK